MTDEELGQVAYAAYGEVTDHKNFQGDPMPAFEDFGDTIRAAWAAAARRVADTVDAQRRDVVVINNIYPQPSAKTARQVAAMMRSTRAQ